MKSHVKVIYWVTILLAVFMLVIIDVHERVDQFSGRVEQEYRIMTNYDKIQYEEKSAPAGVVQEYTWTLQNVPEYEGSIVIYMMHQEAEVYIDDELVYSLKHGEKNFFSTAVGCAWAKIHLNSRDEGRTVRVVIRPLYKSLVGTDPIIYYGSYGAMCGSLIKSAVPLLVMGIIAVLVGVAFIAFMTLNRKNRELDSSLTTLGIFSIFAGLWKICDVPVTPLIFDHPQILSAIALISISMMAISYLFFVRKQFSKGNRKIWNIMCTLSCLCCISIVLLQLTGIADLRQTLTICHIMLVGLIVFVAVMIIREMRITELSTKLKTTVICCLILLLGTGIDLVAYYKYNDSGSMIYGMLAFLIYILVMGYFSLRETIALINRGREAKRFEQMAMHDELTGLYNRAYYAKYLKTYNVQQSDCYVVTFDVNNLKQCNDNNGHDWGDKLLKNSAAIMEQAFGEKGDCIRMGGDEFTVILRHVLPEEVDACLVKFQQLIKKFNDENPEEFPIQIAFGTAYFDDEQDFDFSDTMRRADKKMYQMKMEMKDRTGQGTVLCPPEFFIRFRGGPDREPSPVRQ